jgi:hypothetical protein
MKPSQQSLKDWTEQKWRTKSGKPSTQGSEATGERYLPSKAIEAMSSSEYASTTAKKRKDTKEGKQFSKQPKKAANTARQYRNEGGLMSMFGPMEKPEEGLAALFQNRMQKAEGGSMLVPPEMEAVPEDTYDNIPPEEMEEAMASQLPDGEMVEEYKTYVMTQALEGEEASYLQNALEADPQLNQIFDKVLVTASEFSGAGEVEGPGTGVSDSIPARLSDGEFVMTKKATDQIGAENLQTMMDEAERAYDGGLMSRRTTSNTDLVSSGEEDIKQMMRETNRMPSIG